MDGVAGYVFLMLLSPIAAGRVMGYMLTTILTNVSSRGIGIGSTDIGTQGSLK